MANTKSAKKRIKIIERNRFRNRYYKSSVRTLIKLLFKKIQCYKISQNLMDEKKAKKTLDYVYSLIDKGVKRKVFHKNNGARKKSRLIASIMRLT